MTATAAPRAYRFASDYGPLGTGDDATTIQAALNALQAYEELRISERGFPTLNVSNLTIPDLDGITVDFSGCKLQAVNSGDSDYMIASATYASNYTGSGQPNAKLIRPRLDGRGFKDKVLVWKHAQSELYKPNIRGGITDNLLIPGTTRDGSAQVGNLVEVAVEKPRIDGDIHGDGSAQSAYCFRTAFTGATDGSIKTNAILRNAASANLYLQTAGGWSLHDIHAYNFGSGIVAPTWDCDIQGVGGGARISDCHFENSSAMQVRNINVNDSVPSIIGNHFGLSSGGGTVLLNGVAGAVVALEGNVFHNFCRLHLSGPAGGANPLIAMLTGDRFIGASQITPFIYDGGNSCIVHAHNVRCDGHPVNKITHGWQPTSAEARGITYGTAAPSTGAWVRGDRCIQMTPTVGQPKGWLCTVSGTPGTWVSEGNL